MQRAVSDFLSEGDKCLLKNKVSYGFIKGRSVDDAVNVAKTLRTNKGWAYKTDIASFFDLIDRNILKDKIKKHVRYPTLHKLLIDAVDIEINPKNKSQEKLIHGVGIKNGKGIRQGMPLSPLFSNLLLREFDQKIENKGLSMIRYADDLIFLADSEKECLSIHELCKNLLDELGHTIPDIGTDKSVIADPESPIEFLGIELAYHNGSYQLKLSDSQMSSVKRNILSLSSIDELNRNKITISKLTSKIDAKISGYINAYSAVSNYKLFENSLLSWKKTVLRKIYQDEFQLDINGMSDQAKAFLEIE